MNKFKPVIIGVTVGCFGLSILLCCISFGFFYLFGDMLFMTSQPIPTLQSSSPLKTATIEPARATIPSDTPKLIPTTSATTPAVEVPSPTETMTIMRERKRVVMYSSAWNHTAMTGVAFSANHNLDVISNARLFIDEIHSPDVKAAIVYDEPSNEMLYELADFVDGGGNLLFIYWDTWVDKNEIFQAEFGLSIVISPGVILRSHGDDMLIFPYDILPNWLDDLRIGALVDYLSVYLIVPGSDGERGYVVDDDYSSPLLIYYSSPNSNVTFFPRTHNTNNYGDRNGRNFFDDNNINKLDNQEAFIRILNYLVSK
jgi:hypothetical protein